MPLQLTPIALAVLLLAGTASAAAQTSPPAKPAETVKKADAPIQSVEIKGSAEDYDARRDDTASKTVMNNAEIVKFGDTNIYDVLKRAPGVTVVGNSIRMRGLGNGYTQILVNGERAPPGFSMDALTPDQIEKIEIMRAPAAEFSMQAIAGTINIVLKKVVAKPQRDLRLQAVHSEQSDFAMVGGTIANRVDALSYFLNAYLFSNRNRNGSDSIEQAFDPAENLIKSRRGSGRSRFAMDTLVLAPRLNWKLANGDDLNASFSVNSNRNRSSAYGLTTVDVGVFSVPQYVEGTNLAPSSQTGMNGEVNWIAKLGGGKLDAKLSGSRADRHNATYSDQYTAGRLGRLQRWSDTETRDRQGSLNVKFNRPLFDDHALATGIEASRLTVDEARVRDDHYDEMRMVHIEDSFAPTVTRIAVFAQDEWNVTKQWSMYVGARWEQIRTGSSSASTVDPVASTQSRNQVLSPVAQTLYKFPDKSGRQLRLALTRTFKAPTTQQLTARRYETAVNSEFAADFGGNPQLKPELANGIDFTYERFFAPGALFSVGASARFIDDYIRSRLSVDRNGRWVYQPANVGKARVRTLDVEFKAPLKTLYAAAPPVDVRVSVNRNWSDVSAVPGPNNRLDAQVPLSATLGADYRLAEWTMGASLAFRRGGWVQISDTESQLQQNRRDLDVYALWKFKPGYQLRVGAQNLFGEDNRSLRQYLDENGRRTDRSFSENSARFGASLDMKF